MFLHHIKKKKEPCLCPCTSIPRALSLMNFSRITFTALVYATPAHFRVATLTHNIPTSEPHKGDYPSRAVYDLMLSLILITTTNSECLGSFYYATSSSAICSCQVLFAEPRSIPSSPKTIFGFSLVPIFLRTTTRLR